jgi:hypothetical protein
LLTSHPAGEPDAANVIPELSAKFGKESAVFPKVHWTMEGFSVKEK